ncbi:MAG: dethiobiotin synthase [Alphaproteobacteria bacterium]|nr:dethiobiotin synthase [Alphaproteobacteria bacterium]MDE2042664.1 ATP-dependent dethiobiotin synthetase BioD [Alphaproteobacteria bacterium]MDE2341003.1 ATP-dependent dethiobiotin synthetase BioD [Alphaproteobacteria bacterium]
MSRFVISGTGTDIGKTVFAAALSGALRAHYWKPVQAGLDAETDGGTVARLSGLPASHFLPEAYRLSLPASPHLAAEAEGVLIDVAALTPPPAHTLIIEGAGGVLVPITREILFADLFARWQIPVILVATTALGTISHSLTAIEALKRRGVPIHGIAFIGDAHADNEAIIPALSGVKRLGRLPFIDPLTPETLRAAFTANFALTDFA